MIIDEFAQIIGDIGDIFYYLFISGLDCMFTLLDIVYVPLAGLANIVLNFFDYVVTLYTDIFGFLGDFWFVLFTVMFLLYAFFIVLTIYKSIITLVSTLLSLLPFY